MTCRRELDFKITSWEACVQQELANAYMTPLQLSYNRHLSKGLVHMLASQNLCLNLTKLLLDGCNLTNEDFTVLADADLSNLEELSLHANPELVTDAMSALVTGQWRNLRFLDIGHFMLEASDLAISKHADWPLMKIFSLGLTSIGFSSAAIAKLIGLHWPYLETLTLTIHDPRTPEHAWEAFFALSTGGWGNLPTVQICVKHLCAQGVKTLMFHRRWPLQNMLLRVHVIEWDSLKLFGLNAKQRSKVRLVFDEGGSVTFTRNSAKKILELPRDSAVCTAFPDLQQSCLEYKDDTMIIDIV